MGKFLALLPRPSPRRRRRRRRLCRRLSLLVRLFLFFVITPDSHFLIYFSSSLSYIFFLHFLWQSGRKRRMRMRMRRNSLQTHLPFWKKKECSFALGSNFNCLRPPPSAPASSTSTHFPKKSEGKSLQVECVGRLLVLHLFPVRRITCTKKSRKRVDKNLLFLPSPCSPPR